MNFVPPAPKFRDDVPHQKLGVAPRHVDIESILAGVAVKNIFKRIKFLYFVQKKEIMARLSRFPIDESRKLIRVHLSFLNRCFYQKRI